MAVWPTALSPSTLCLFLSEPHFSFLETGHTEPHGNIGGAKPKLWDSGGTTHHLFLLKFPPDSRSDLGLLLQVERGGGSSENAEPKEGWGN